MQYLSKPLQKRYVQAAVLICPNAAFLLIETIRLNKAQNWSTALNQLGLLEGCCLLLCPRHAVLAIFWAPIAPFLRVPLGFLLSSPMPLQAFLPLREHSPEPHKKRDPFLPVPWIAFEMGRLCAPRGVSFFILGSHDLKKKRIVSKAGNPTRRPCEWSMQRFLEGMGSLGFCGKFSESPKSSPNEPDTDLDMFSRT